MSVSLDAGPVKTGPVRARCAACGARWAWPAGAELPEIEPLVRPQASCPRCSLVGPLTPEPHDERWWRWLVTEEEAQVRPSAPSHHRAPERPPTRQSAPAATTPSGSRTVHRPAAHRGSGGVPV